MEALVLRKEIEPLPIRKNIETIDTYEGFLNSSYKQVAKTNFFHSKPHTIFGIRQRIKSAQYQMGSHVATLLKLTVFTIALGIALI